MGRFRPSHFKIKIMSRGKQKQTIEPTETAQTPAPKVAEQKYLVLKVLPNYAYYPGDVITLIEPKVAEYFLKNEWIKKA